MNNNKEHRLLDSLRCFSGRHQKCISVGFMKLAISSLFFWVLNIHAQATDLQQVIAADNQGLRASQQAQVAVSQLSDEQQILQQQYREVLWQQRVADKYQLQLDSQINALHNANDELERQREQVRKTQIAVSPLMQDMLSTLQQVVESDIPFLQAERKLRVQILIQNLADPRIILGDKMAQVLDAYQVELSYGYAAETWLGTLDSERMVNFLRVGRLGYYWLSIDGQQAAIWKQGEGWVQLEEKWFQPLRQAIAVAAGNIAPDIMTLPRPDQASVEGLS